MLADAHAGQFSLIVAHKLDRLLRNLKLHLGIVEDLKKINVTLQPADEAMKRVDEAVKERFEKERRQKKDGLV